MCGSEQIDSFWDKATGEPRNIFWFSEDWAAYRNRDNELSYDNHFLHGEYE